jgi:hypothetical protein
MATPGQSHFQNLDSHNRDSEFRGGPPQSLPKGTPPTSFKQRDALLMYRYRRVSTTYEGMIYKIKVHENVQVGAVCERGRAGPLVSVRNQMQRTDVAKSMAAWAIGVQIRTHGPR